jgi:hypothetical protein
VYVERERERERGEEIEQAKGMLRKGLRNGLCRLKEEGRFSWWGLLLAERDGRTEREREREQLLLEMNICVSLKELIKER